MAVPTGTLGTLKIRLADWVPPSQRYRRRYVPVDTQSEVESGDVPSLVSSPEFRSWRIRSWRGGEGITWWERDRRQYRQSTNVRPVSIRDGLELGASQSVAQLTGGGGDYAEGSRFGFGLGGMWAADDGAAGKWDPSGDHFDATMSTGAGASDVTSLTDGDDTWMYSGHATKAIWRWKSGSQEEHFDTTTDPFSTVPVVRSFKGVLYALDGDDLYEIDKTAADTRTQRGDSEDGSSAVYLAATPWSYGRMSLSDRGPIWLTRLDNGQTFLKLYNPFLDTQETLGKLGVDFAFPYSLFFARGFAFTAFRYAPAHARSGDAYLWIKRGAQESYAGPFRAPTGVTAAKPILIAGMIGDDLIVYFDGAVWAYNLTDGGIYQMAKATTTTTNVEDAITVGKDIFIGPVTSTTGNKVERFNTEAYTTEDASIDLGKIDFDYPGLGKGLLDVTVITDPLPAATTLEAWVSVDGAAFVQVGATSTTDNQTKHKFTASTSAGSTRYGNEFEIRLVPDSTVSTASPTIREVSARATGMDHVLEVIMTLDAGDIDDQLSETLISGLNSLAAPTTDPVVVSFTDPFQVRDKTTDDVFDVVVKDVHTPELMRDSVREGVDPVSAVVRVQAASLT